MSRDELSIERQHGALADVGVVIIGRNEGERLRTCIESVLCEQVTAVYVDSGSVDDSVALARSFGLPVIELDPARPFTAARARNAGADQLEERFPSLPYIHFIDGDCEMVAGWLPAARAALEAEPGTGAVCGRRRERHPDSTPYNRLCDLEWNTSVGYADTVGGDALFRLVAFRDGGGFSAELIAGEEPDLCHRVRLAGWRIRRLDHDMTVHDAAMTRFGQWWQRNRRSGYATAEALWRRGMRNPRMWRNVLSNLFWALPLAWPLLPVLWLRVCWRRGALEASFITLGKLPHCQGQLDYWRNARRLIEYK
jgi:glycosyltransferase involved in cell wall biosynthesis